MGNFIVSIDRQRSRQIAVAFGNTLQRRCNIPQRRTDSSGEENSDNIGDYKNKDDEIIEDIFLELSKQEKSQVKQYSLIALLKIEKHIETLRKIVEAKDNYTLRTF